MLGLLAGLASLAFAPGFLHPGANGGEVISSAGLFTAFPPIFVVALTLAIGPVAARVGATLNIG
jgi:hypothetical protein